jgi:DNA mismatch repair protein MutL
MVDVTWTPEAATSGGSDPPVRRVTGLVSHPETTRSTREYLATYVNDRYVTASALREATLDAYGGQLAPDRYPFAVLFVEVPPGDVDVNVHPRKLEVRFDEEPAVRAAVEDAVESALLDHGLIRSTAPRGQSAPEETAVRPEHPETEAVGGAGTDHERAPLDGRDEGGDPDDPDDGHRSETTTGAAALNPTDEDAWSVGDVGGTGGIAGTGGGRDDSGTESRPSPRSWQSGPEPADGATDAGDGDSHVGASRDTGTVADRTNESSVGKSIPGGDPTPVDADASNTDATDIDAIDTGPDDRRDPPSTQTARRPPRSTAQRTLGDDASTTTEERSYDSLPPLRVLGQLHETYVIAEAPDGLVLIDQHAADERVNYERLQAAFDDGADAQALAEPVRVELTAREAAVFDEFIEDLLAIGFRAERADERAVVVEAVPAVFDAALDPDLVRDVLSALVGDATAGDEPVTDIIDELLADLACYPSVTGNTSLTEGRVVDLLDRLDACENPYACPHGRPVVIRLDREEIGSRFERDYPGHAGRRAE